jgi:uncharacterized repeat protein (TIGR02059 family)
LILTLLTAVSSAGVIKVQYTDPTANNDYYAAQDVNGNDLATFAQTQITNNTDGTAPVLKTTSPVDPQTTFDGKQIMLTFNENLSSTLPSLSQFAISVDGGTSFAPSSVFVNGPNLFLTLPVANTLTYANSLTVKYTAPSVNNANTNAAIQDIYGNDATSLPITNVSNSVSYSLDSVSPTILVGSSYSYRSNNGLNITLRTSESIFKTNWSTSNTDPNYIGNAFTFTVDGAERAVTAVGYLYGDERLADVMTFTLAGPDVPNSSVVKMTYTDQHPSAFDAWSVRDFSNNELASFAARTVPLFGV